MEPEHHNNSKHKNVPDAKNQHNAVQLKGQYQFILNWYKLNGRNLLDEEVLEGLQINTLMKILGNPIWNDIYHCWAVENKHMANLQPYTKHKFNPDKFTYFIEVYHNN